jgi:5-oxoprolinase (ATP-hydrolysing) subunit A
MTNQAEINCDLGEGFALYRYGDDEGLAPHIHIANIACGVHGGDPTIMARTVALALRHALKIGAHPSLPDLAGFGRREMNIKRAQLRDCLVYQIGALKGFLDAAGAPLSHVKPHGVMYSMAARDRELAEGLCDAVEPFGVPLFGISGTQTEAAARSRGIPFVAEFFVDLAYADDGSLIVQKDHAVDPVWVESRLRRAVREGTLETVGGKIIPLAFQTICIHNDMPNATEVAATVRRALDFP